MLINSTECKMTRTEKEQYQQDSAITPVEILLTSTIVEAGIFQIKCPANPITHAFLQFTDSEERDKHIRSAKMPKPEWREKNNIIISMDADGRFRHKTWIHQILLLQNAWNTDREDHSEPRAKTRISRRTGSGQNIRKWISQVPHVPKCGERSRRLHRW